ncbi:uncharacterized protein LOC130677405 [Microplitis mediator]|uniref:uncharacterized protein LOC130677405 n=1 Tax=Microplitis mediator TaxID=375433 RepID=UPI0025521B91|nr:uncharacterized protein LOC130677405 [Microplitis mediator]
MNLLSSFYLCTKNDLMIYMFNPFTNRAPKPWTEVKIGNKESDDPWTLYSQPYSEDHEYCESLFFDKTKKLDGYNINAVANSTTHRELNPKKVYNTTTMRGRFSPYLTNIFTTIFSHINVTPLIYFDLLGAPVPAKEIGYVKGLIDGSYDIALSGHTAGANYNVSHAYPAIDLELVILTQHRQFLTTFEKICRFYSMGVILLSSLVLVMTSLLITIYYKKNFVEASAEVLKMALSASTDIPLITFPIRIYFFGVLLLILIINATFQGHLAAFLTQPERITVDSLSDLQELEYKIYLQRSAFKLTDGWSKFLRDKTHTADTTIDCMQHALDDPNAGCVAAIPRLLQAADRNLTLHVSPVVARPLVIFLERYDWPLKKVVDIDIRRLLETGVTNFWDRKEFLEPLKKLHLKESFLTEAQYRPIEFKDIDFAFIILGICLLFTIIVSIFEFYYGYYIYCD